MMKTKLQALLFISLFLVTMSTVSIVKAAEQVTIFIYQASAPFVTDASNKKGLSYELATYFSTKSAAKYDFQVKILPRKRLNQLLENGTNGIVPWVSNFWFQDPKETKYLWTDGFFKDANAVISNPTKPIEYQTPETLIGLTLGGVFGHRYKGIDALSDAGKVKRVDVNNGEKNLKKLMAGRIDVMLIPRSSLQYTVANQGIGDKIHVSVKPHSEYSRRILVLNKRQDLKEFLQVSIKNMGNDPQWQTALKSYNQ